MDQNTKDLIIATLTLVVGVANWFLHRNSTNSLLVRIVSLEQQLAECLQSKDSPPSA